jgi:predicted nucleic acid-binding protein
VAIAENTYADPSALLKLYLNEPGSLPMARWRTTARGSLAVTHHGRVELANGISLAAHRGFLDADAYSAALAALDDDFRLGRYAQVDLLWRATLRRAGELSRAFSRELGTRTLDVIHVASALELKLPVFLTFDARQRNLARAVGLKNPAPGL